MKRSCKPCFIGSQNRIRWHTGGARPWLSIALALSHGSPVRLNQIGNPPLDVGQTLHGNLGVLFMLKHMTPITYLAGSSGETRLCRRKATECQRIALTTTDPNIRLRFSHLAKLWREMADEAARPKVSTTSEERGVVLFLNQFQKAK